ncbi:alpha-glucan family phosphorylase [Chthonomonas calidirosea]|uniref:alpha-glucan family phosphorylase n=1 Tax=Chthonomonas calidirosea TaxID=454171 RepID=UPI0006EC7DC0|nr:alpha-glucan family phosphorylase [Chthonomonas calidirosea]CEK19486.1 maltodextrin phosphorylase [Chthonomonas calidirosea]
MPKIRAFHIVPALPEPLQKLRTLAYNLRWAWDHETIELFRSLDRNLWEQCEHNPVRMLSLISQERLTEAAADDAFLAGVDHVHYSLQTYLTTTNTWYRRQWADKLPPETCIAYFCMEFGLTECLPIYSGGLGVLAGDHLKSASDLGLPLVGVGLLYQQGYFKQTLSPDGWQQETYPENDFYSMPLQAVLNEKGEPLKVCLELPGRQVSIRVWRAQVGRVPLFLLDTNLPENRPEDQDITDQLYGGDAEMRLRQEMVLGIGGMRALRALKIRPTVCHLNEGHAAFTALERARELREETGCDYATAREVAAAGSLFTTHTPVPAGFDVFSADLMNRYFAAYAQQLGLSFDELMGLGRVNPWDQSEQFNMAVLAVRHAHQVNGVSQLHARVTRRMMQAGYPGFPEEEVPASYVTNGVHLRSFASMEMAELLDKYLGGRWSYDGHPEGVWERIEEIPDELLWWVKETRREKLVRFARARLRAQLERRYFRDDPEFRAAAEVLDPHALTIGFARRFAPYKRATLLLTDPDRLIRLLTNPQRPVQILFAGKAHPREDAGKELIRQIVQFSKRPEVRGRILFLEDYDLNVSRYMVQGCDVWLNTPRRPMEASGTSGMKALVNGGLHVSVLDGWWAEGYDPRAGWAIGRGEEYSDPQEQDRIEATALYNLLENEVVPLFYDRGMDGVPRAWVARVKYSMRTLCPRFNTHRMVSEYATRYYFPATLRCLKLRANNLERARTLVDWKQRVRSLWPQVRIQEVITSPEEGATLQVGDKLKITVKAFLAGLTPEDVRVQAYSGSLDADRRLKAESIVDIPFTGQEGELFCFQVEMPCSASGLRGFSVRILPAHPDAQLPAELPLICWE